MKWYRHPDRLADLLLLALSAGAFIAALRFPHAAEAHSGPGSFPLALSVLLAILALAGWVTRKPPAAPVEETTVGTTHRLPSLAGMTALYLLVLPLLGFISATALLGMGALIVLGYRHPARALAFGFLAAYALYVTFGVLMNVALPKGWIG